MSRIKDLQERVAWLEEQVYDLKKSRHSDMEYFEERYKDVESLIERYVQSHIWYTTNSNIQAYHKGERVKVVVEDLKNIIGD